MTTIHAELVQCGECKLYRRVDKSITTCDVCQVVSDDSYPYLTTTAFNNADATKSYDYCSWKCVFKHLHILEADNFLDLPSVTFYNDDNPKVNTEAFFTELKNFK